MIAVRFTHDFSFFPRRRSMAQVWLRTNRRVYAWGLVLPGLIACAGVLLIAGLFGAGAGWLPPLGWVLIGLGLLVAVAQILEMLKPRLSVDADHLWVNAGRQPIGVPLKIVECFLLGQGPAHLPGEKFRTAESTNLVIRLAETALDWKRRDVDHKIAGWCDGYITLRGTWCEPLSVDLVLQLNRNLTQAHRAQRERRLARQPHGVGGGNEVPRQTSPSSGTSSASPCCSDDPACKGSA